MMLKDYVINKLVTHIPPLNSFASFLFQWQKCFLKMTGATLAEQHH